MTRTHDLLITNQLLYRLSYTSIGSGNHKADPMQFRPKYDSTKKRIRQHEIENCPLCNKESFFLRNRLKNLEKEKIPAAETHLFQCLQ